MSLFPAYSCDLGKDASPTVAVNAASKCDVPKDSWLENPSFTLEVSEIPLPTAESIERLPSVNVPSTLPPSDVPFTLSSTDTADRNSQVSPEIIVIEDTHSPPAKSLAKKRLVDDAENDKSRKRHKRKHSKSRKHDRHSKRSAPVQTVIPVVPEENKCFYTDKKSERGNLNVVKLHRPAVPLYRTPYYFVVGLVPYSYQYADRKKNKKNKRRKQKDRYFNNRQIYDPDDTSSAAIGEATQESTMEGNITKKTADFNKTLGEDKHDVAMWLAYADFQDVVCEFERTFRRGGGGGGGRRVAAQRKLAILDKALALNPGAESILRRRCQLVTECFPGDEAARQFQALIEKRPQSMALWQGLIGSTQFNLSSCSVSKVLRLYETAMSRFHAIRRVAAAETPAAERSILELLLRCATFLRQAGLQEQLWTLLKHYVELNLGQPTITSAATGGPISERRIVEAEEPALLSNLPLPEIWVRVETVRESSHWLAWDDDGDCADPQRVVFAEDVAEMLHPITCADLAFRLAHLVLTAFKVPPLPHRDSASAWAGLAGLGWAVDSTEPLLTALFPLGPTRCGAFALLSPAAEFVTGPAYLAAKTKPVALGNAEYLAHVGHVFHACADKMAAGARTALLVWYLRFLRFQVVLAEGGVCHALLSKKKVRAVVKEFLKDTRNRDNLAFYREFALLERDAGNTETGIAVLESALSARGGAAAAAGTADPDARAELVALARALAELLLAAGRRDRALALLVELALGAAPAAAVTAPVAAAADKMRHVARELLAGAEEGEADGTEHLSADEPSDWSACCGWLLYLTESVWAAGAFYEEALEACPLDSSPLEGPVSKRRCRREAFTEGYVALMHFHCERSPGAFSALNPLLARALKDFPGNAGLLAVAVGTQGSEARPWWQLRRLLGDADSQLAHLALVFLARQQQAAAATAAAAAIPGHALYSIHSAGAGGADAVSLRNRLRGLFRWLSTHPSTRRCPLAWRLHLRFLFEHADAAQCRAAFHQAVEQCPWVKALYLDGARLLPADIGEVQDLIIEKELRLHVTPEELEILRSSSI